MTSPNNRARRLKAAGWVRVEVWAPPDWADRANALIAVSEARADETKLIEVIPGKPGRKPRGETKRKTKPRKAERIATAPGKPGPKPKEAKG